MPTMNSKSGMSSMAPDTYSTFTKEEVVELLRESHSLNIKTIKWKGLEAEFFNLQKIVNVEQTVNPESYSDRTREMDEARIKQDQIDQMYIENPLEAEKLLAQEHLADEDEDDDEDIVL